MRFAYSRRGGPLLDWSGPTPPYPTRSGETRSLGDFYPTTRTSSALRRYGGRGMPKGAAISYEHNRPLGYWGAQTAGHGGAGFHPPHMLPSNTLLGDLMLPRPGAPEVVEGYESPAPGAAVVHLGAYMPEGAARKYGQVMLDDDAPPAPAKPAAPISTTLIRRGAMVAAAYHGVRRNNGSVLWGALWAIAAYIAPVHGLLVPAIGAAQGFAQPKVRSNPARRYRRRRSRR